MGSGLLAIALLLLSSPLLPLRIVERDLLAIEFALYYQTLGLHLVQTAGDRKFAFAIFRQCVQTLRLYAAGLFDQSPLRIRIWRYRNVICMSQRTRTQQGK